MGKIKAFFERKNVTLSPKVYFIDAMSGMALGLFASLLIGTIFGTVADLTGWEALKTISTNYLGAKSMVVGAALAAGIAKPLNAPPLVTYSAIAVGAIANDLGGPAGAFIAAVVAIELGKLVSKETPIDIIVTPTVTILAGGLLAMLIGPWISELMAMLGEFIMWATEREPFLMGIIVSVVVGIVLTLPISSAALCAMVGIGGIAGGAALAGCCAQMIGFAFMSYKENKMGGLVAQGLGTSMLQVGNIVKNPWIWVPPTLASAITGPLATCLFKLEIDAGNLSVTAGMGTCGLVGPIGAISSMDMTAFNWIGLLLICLVLPAILSVAFCEIMRKMKLIKENDLKLEL